MIFVGNKTDLLTVPSIVEDEYEEEEMKADEKEEEKKADFSRYSSGESDSEMSTSAVVSVDEEMQSTARNLIDNLGYPMIDTSARLGCNVLEVFHSILWPMLSTNSNLIGRIGTSDIANGHYGEDSPIHSLQEPEAISKKISWPWRNASDHPVGCGSFSPSSYNDFSTINCIAE